MSDILRNIETAQKRERNIATQHRRAEDDLDTKRKRFWEIVGPVGGHVRLGQLRFSTPMLFIGAGFVAGAFGMFLLGPLAGFGLAAIAIFGLTKFLRG